MSIIGWLILGHRGFIGSKIVNKSGEGLLLDIVLGCKIASKRGSCALLVQVEGRSRRTEASSEQIQIRPSIHLPFDQLEFCNLAFGLSV